LYHAAASVSLCGYNTALDVLQAGCPAVFVPFDAGKEVEQGIRASALAAQPAITMIRSADLRPEALLNALAQVTAAPRPAPMRRGLDGAAQTVAITHALQQARS
jgi:predicted glycosyltransferase